MDLRQRELLELQTHAGAGTDELQDADQVDAQRQQVETKLQELLEPLRCRKRFLLASREGHQFNRDVEDEIVSSLTSDLSGRIPGDVTHLIFALSFGFRRRLPSPSQPTMDRTCRRCNCSSRRTR